MANIKRNLEISTESLNFPIISVEEVGSALNLMLCNKAGGDDGLKYEHLIYGGPFLHEILSKFFNAIVRFSYAPKAMKRGVIITIFKGGNKRKDNPDNYRAITLSSVLVKVLERILLTRIELFDHIQPPLHPFTGRISETNGLHDDVIFGP